MSLRERKDKDKKIHFSGAAWCVCGGVRGRREQGRVKARHALFSIHNFNYVSSSSGMLIKKLEENSLIAEKLCFYLILPINGRNLEEKAQHQIPSLFRTWNCPPICGKPQCNRAGIYLDTSNVCLSIGMEYVSS